MTFPATTARRCFPASVRRGNVGWAGRPRSYSGAGRSAAWLQNFSLVPASATWSSSTATSSRSPTSSGRFYSTEQDVAEAMPKAHAARRRLARINSSVRVTAIVDDLNRGNIARYASGADVLVDGLDNFGNALSRQRITRYVTALPISMAAQWARSARHLRSCPHTASGDAPWERDHGNNRATPCLRCLFEEAPPPGTLPTCETVGVLASAVTTIAGFQVAETLKVAHRQLRSYLPDAAQPGFVDEHHHAAQGRKCIRTR